MAGSDSSSAVAGGPARHIPVLGREAVGLLNVRDGGVYVDATFGDGGYTRAILAAANATVVAIDRDPAAIAHGAALARAAGGRLFLDQRNFSELDTATRSLGQDVVDGVVLDAGVSTMQLDDPARGFSFRHDGPLDMRMGNSGPTAAEIVASASEQNLARILAVLGEERHARAIARAIVRARRAVPVRTTRVLAGIIADVIYPRAGRIHPATRTFQALRIFVNQELTELAGGLAAAERVLKPGGRLVAVSFHSLEDRIVKSFLAERSRGRGASRHIPEAPRQAATFRLLVKRPIIPTQAEIAANPRARSAKLRAGERTDAASLPGDVSRLLPRLPSLSEIMGQAQ
jgi:16S rRNA (cytosine1402-N4)-methyltransferase